MSPEPTNTTSPFDHIDGFLATLEEPSYATCKSTLKCFRTFVHDTGRNPCALSREDVEAWKDYLDARQKPSSVNRKLVALSAFYRWLSERTGCANIVDGVKRHPNQPFNKRKALTTEQIEAIMRTISNCRSYKDYLDRAIVHLLLRTGLSNTQLRNILVKDYMHAGNQAVLRVRIRDGEALIPLHAEVEEYINAYLRQRRMRQEYFPESPLFANVQNRSGRKPNAKVDSRTISTAVDRILKRSGVTDGIGRYSFPLTAMNLAIEGGATVKEVYELSVLLRIPKRFFRELSDGSSRGTPYDPASEALAKMEAELRRGLVKCSDLRGAPRAFGDDDLLEVRIDDTGDLRIIPIMKTSKISFGLAL